MINIGPPDEDVLAMKHGVVGLQSGVARGRRYHAMSGCNPKMSYTMHKHF